MCEEEITFEINNGIIHGATIHAGTLSDTLIEKAWGYADIDGNVKMRTDTIIDMASVTKALATTSALAICFDEGLLDFDTPFTAYLPEYTAPLKNPVTVRDLAMHLSGFGQQNHYTANTGGEIRKKLVSVPPQNPPREKFEYSCWNYHLLGMIIENVTGKSLDHFCSERIFSPLGMRNTSLGKPLTSNPELLAKTCGTEKPGQISDFIAFKLYRDGFTAGNAGVFSCAPDLAKFCRCLLNSGKYSEEKQLFSDAAFEAITTPRMFDAAVKRSLGWIVSDELKPRGFSPRTIYHSGWSGQTIFLDLDKAFYAVVLTTRTLNEYERARRGRFKMIEEIGKYVN
ncbi:MAG: serine hydrolase [Verrucomicrobiae bacterium]|nr:serine hydrolase [Verrucomicrobiae bacterium]